MKQDLNRVIQECFASAYEPGGKYIEPEYQQEFANEGFRKAVYVVDDLLYREANGQLRTNEMAYFCVGGADGSEVEHVLTSTRITKALMVEISHSAGEQAKKRVDALANLGKEFIIITGDVTAILEDCLNKIENWANSALISGLICSAQGVLHELPSRSPGFDLPIFLGRLYRSPKWRTCAFYAREPCFPLGWPKIVRVRIPGLSGNNLARFAKFVRDRNKMNGEIEVLASNWVVFPADIAIETLHKLLRGNSIRRIGYELDEQLTSFDPMDVKRNLESCVDGMHVAVEPVITLGFKRALQNYNVEYLGHNAEALPVPRTHSEIVGILPLKSTDVFVAVEQIPPKVKIESSEEVHTIEFSNPFKGDISNERIRKWLSQFKAEEQPIIARLIDGFIYINLMDVRNLSKQLFSIIQSRLISNARSLYYVPLGGIARSGEFVSYFFRRENTIDISHFLNYSDINSLVNAENMTLVLLDDILASGHQAVNEWNVQKKKLGLLRNTKVILATLVSYEEGARYVEEHADLDVCSALPLSQDDGPLSPTSSLFKTDIEREKARTIIKKYGEYLTPGRPFGYAETGLLFSFAHSTPDNSLPIFWSRNNNWFPLFDTGGSTRMSDNLNINQ